MTKILYTAEATSEGGRYQARAFSSDGNLDVRIEPPVELGGPDDIQATNPEQLFAAGYAACFHSAMKTIAAMKEIDLSDTLVVARVSLIADEGGLGLQAELDVTVPKLEAADAEKLVRRAHRRCPYSRVTAGGMAVAITVNGAPLEIEAPA